MKNVTFLAVLAIAACILSAPALAAGPIAAGTVTLLADTVAADGLPAPVVAMDYRGQVLTGIVTLASDGEVLAHFDRRWTDRSSYRTDVSARTASVDARDMHPADFSFRMLDGLMDDPATPVNKEFFAESVAKTMNEFDVRLDRIGRYAPILAAIVPKGTVLGVQR